MTRWKHEMIFDTDSLTLIEWYLQELPKYIRKYQGVLGYENQIISAQAKLNLFTELGLSDGNNATISRPCEQTTFQGLCREDKN